MLPILVIWQATCCTMKSLLHVFISKSHRPRVVKLQASHFRPHAVACPLCFSLSAWLLATVRFPWLLFAVSPSSRTGGHFREQSLDSGQSQCQDSTESSDGARTRPGSKIRQQAGSYKLSSFLDSLELQSHRSPHLTSKMKSRKHKCQLPRSLHVD